MSKEVEEFAIAKKSYSFKKGFLQISLANKKDCRKRIMDILSIKRESYFSALLNSGIVELSKTKFDAITALFHEYGITEIWDIE